MLTTAIMCTPLAVSAAHAEALILLFLCMGHRGGSRISRKGVHMFKGVGVRFADFILIFLKYPMKMK